MSEALRHRKAGVHVGWRLGSAVVLAAVATAIGAGTQPAFAAPKPAPGVTAKAKVGHSTGHHANKAKPKAGAAAHAAKSGRATKNRQSTRAGASANGIRPEGTMTGVTADPGLDSVLVGWPSGASGSPPAVSYTVDLSPGTGTCTVADPQVNCAINNLTPGDYTATVTSYDDVGGSAGTGNPIDTGTTTFTVAPVTVTPGFTTALVSWPTDIALSAASYVVTVNGGGGGGTGCGTDEPSSPASTPGDTLSCTISTLAANTSYTVTVTSYSAAGGGGSPIDSADSATFTETTPTATPGATDATVTWPAVPGAVTYDVTVDNGGTGCTGILSTDPRTCTLGSLTTGQTYTATVTANDVGGSPIDTAQTLPFTIGTPDAPQFVTASPGQSSIDVSWLPPVSGGSGVDHYVVTASPGPGTCSTTSGSPATSCTISSGVYPGVAYVISVVAVGNGTSGQSATATMAVPVVVGPPPAPTDVSVTPGVGQVVVSWTEEAGFSPVDYFTATATPSPSGPTNVCHTPTADFTSCTITGLTPLTSYTVTVVAHGSGNSGDSASSDASATVVPIPAMFNIKANANNMYVTAENAGAKALVANRSTPGAWEWFNAQNNSDGTISLMAHINTKWVSADAGGHAPLIANRTSVGSWEKFWLVSNGDGTWSLKAVADDRYVTAEGGGAGPLIANRTSVGGWEKFTFMNLAP